LESRSPVEITIHSLYSLSYGAGHTKVSSTKRKVKDREYIRPHVNLKAYFNKHIGKDCVVLEGRASLENWSGYEFKDVIVLVVGDRKKKQTKSQLKTKEEARLFVADSKKRLKKAKREMEKKLTLPKN
jgi:hypothetical protein